MRICIFGTGAVGGHLAVRLSRAHQAQISVVARGPMLQAIHRDGLTLQTDGRTLKARPSVATDDPSTLPPQDVVFVTLKSHAVPNSAAAIARMLAPDGCAVFLLNGIPWWWNFGSGSGETLPLLDPDRTLWNTVKPNRVLGCVLYSPNEVVEPGVIAHQGPNTFWVGEPDNSLSDRLRLVVDALSNADIDAKATGDLRREVLKKLVSNASGNALSALGRIDLGTLSEDADLRSLAMRVMTETLSVAKSLGWDLYDDVDVEKVARRGRPGGRTSMLQDILAGRPLEVEAIVGQLQTFAKERKVPVPTLDVLLPLLRGLDQWQRVQKQA